MMSTTASRAAVRSAASATVRLLEPRVMLDASAFLEDGEFIVGIPAWETGAYAYRIELLPADPTYVRALADGRLIGVAPLSEIKSIGVYLGPGDDRVEIGDGIRKPIEVSDDGGDDTLVGSADDDAVLDGGWGDDLIIGNGGDDEIWGGPGNDTIRGGAGDDELWGSAYQMGDDEPDRDFVDGGAGDDRLEGDWDDDTLVADEGRDTARGGSGQDEIIGAEDSLSRVEEGFWQINGDADARRPDDKIVVTTDAKNLGVLRAIVNGKVLARVKASAVRSIMVDAGEGDDVVRFDLPKSLGHLRLHARGRDGDDRIYGTSHTDDDLSGDRGDDTIDGGEGGDDNLWGDEGNDVVTPYDAEYGYGEKPAAAVFYEDDALWDVYVNVTPDRKGKGQRVLIRVAPDDAGVFQLIGNGELLATAPAEKVGAILVSGSPYGDRITMKLPRDFKGQLEVNGMDGNDTLVGGGGEQILMGGYGDDVLVGGADDDVMAGETGDDVIRGGPGDDYGNGGGGDDTLLGGKGDDELRGGKGDDRIDGQGGANVLRGGAGKDTLAGGEDEAESKKAKRRAANELLDVRDPLAGT